MDSVFLISFLGMLNAVAKVVMIGIIAGFLVQKKIILQEHIKGLSEITVMVLLPALIFSKTITTFKPSATVGWWILPLIGISIPLVGLAISKLLFFKRPKEHRNVLAIASFPNSAYLVLPIGQVIFPKQFDEFALYSFLFIMGYNPVLWSIGKYYSTSSSANSYFKIKEIITPPLIANLTSVLIVLIGIQGFIPNLITEPIGLIGSATVPMATFVLGATLGGISFKIWPKLIDIIKVITIRYILVPAITVLALFILNIHGYSALLASFLVIEASAAPATNIIVMIRKYGGDIQQVGSMMIVCYVVAIIAMPFWVALWDMICQFK